MLDFTILPLTLQWQLQNSYWMDQAAFWFDCSFSEFVPMTSTELLFYCFFQQCSPVNHTSVPMATTYTWDVAASFSASIKIVRRENNESGSWPFLYYHSCILLWVMHFQLGIYKLTSKVACTSMPFLLQTQM